MAQEKKHTPLNPTPAEVRRYIKRRCPDVKQPQGRDHVRGPCPIHKGKDPNFSINLNTGKAQCFSQCSGGWDLVGLEAALSGAPFREAYKSVLQIVGRPASNGKAQAGQQRTFTYRDPTGKPLFDVVRTDTEEGKNIYQRAHDGKGGFSNNLEGVSRILYRLPEVLSAEEVFIAEGEVKVDLLRKWGLIATCNPGGTGMGFTAEHAEALKGKRLVILPDNDEAGRKHSAKVRTLCQGKAAEIVTVELPGLDTAGDVVNWAEAGGTKEQLLALVEQARSQVQEQARPLTSDREFRSDHSGLYIVPSDRKKAELWIAPPLKVVARTRDFSGDSAGVLLEFTDWEGKSKRRVLPLKALMGDGREGLETLLDSGYTPKRARACFDSVKDYIYSTNPDAWVRITTRTGMHGSSFVFPDRTIGPEGEEPVLFYSEETVPHRYRSAGTLEEWRDNIGAPCSGNKLLVMAVSTAFAPPLLPLLKAQSAGVHFKALSSKGKTTALLVAGSVWGGDSESGFLDTWKSTSSGLEARASLHNHALLTLDEIGLAAPDEVGEAVYALCNGTGKLRANRTTSARTSSQFTLIFLSSGECGLREFMRSGGRQVKGGQEARLIEISADAGAGMGIFDQVPSQFSSPAAFANSLKQRAQRFYGTAIQEYLQRLTHNVETVARETTAARGDFVRRNTRMDDSGEVFRIAETFGIIAHGGELATKWGLTGWRSGEATAAIEACFHSVIEERGGTGARDIEYGIRAVRSFIEAHGNSRFQNLDAGDDERIINRVGFKEQQGSRWTYYVLPERWESEVCEGFDSKEIARAMIARGFLPRQPGKHLTTRKSVRGFGVIRVFAIQPGLFDVEEAPFDAESLEISSNGSLETVF